VKPYLGRGHSQNKRGERGGGAKAAAYSENNALSPEGFTVCKAQLLNILNLKSSAEKQIMLSPLRALLCIKHSY